MKRKWRLIVGMGIAALLLGMYGVRDAAAGRRAATGALGTQPTSGALPAGPDLVARMQAVLARAGSVHVDSTVSVSIPGSSRTVVRDHVDFSWRDSRVSSHATTRSTSLHTQPATITTDHSTTIIVGHREAYRSERDPWKCGPSTESLKALRALLAGFLHTQAQGARTLGAETIAGVPVWHVVATAHIPFLSATPTDHSIDLYLAQSDAHAIKQTLATTGTGQPIIYITVANVYARYGTSVSTPLPTACTGKS